MNNLGYIETRVPGGSYSINQDFTKKYCLTEMLEINNLTKRSLDELVNNKLIKSYSLSHDSDDMKKKTIILYYYMEKDI